MTQTRSRGGVAAAIGSLVARIAQTLDTNYPSAVVEPDVYAVDEPAHRYMIRGKPDFVLADDEGWGPPPLE